MISDKDVLQKEFVISNRLYVEQTLKRYFKASQIRIRWMPDDHAAELFLDTLKGKFELEVQSLDEILEQIRII